MRGPSTTTSPTAAVPPLSGRGAADAVAGAIPYVAAAVTVAALVAYWTPSYVVMPMGRETHYMALVGPANPGAPWTLLGLMAAPVLIVYGLILPTVAGWLPERAAKAGVLALGLVTAGIAGYLVRWAIWPLSSSGGWHGLVDWVSMVAFAATSLPALAAGAVLAGRGRLATGLVVAAGIVLHVGMIGGMLAADLLGGGGMGAHG
jgi:hypothetical protein